MTYQSAMRVQARVNSCTSKKQHIIVVQKHKLFVSPQTLDRLRTFTEKMETIHTSNWPTRQDLWELWTSKNDELYLKQCRHRKHLRKAHRLFRIYYFGGLAFINFTPFPEQLLRMVNIFFFLNSELDQTPPIRWKIELCPKILFRNSRMCIDDELRIFLYA